MVSVVQLLTLSLSDTSEALQNVYPALLACTWLPSLLWYRLETLCKLLPWPFNHWGWRVLWSSGKLIAASFCLLVGERLDQPIISRGYAHISPVLGSTSSCNFNSKNLWSYISSHPLKRKDFYFWMTLPYSGTIAWSCWHRVDVAYITTAFCAWNMTWSRISTTSHSKDLVCHSSDFTGYSGWLWRGPELVKCHVIMLKYGVGWRI